jgi:hypothetical protein
MPKPVADIVDELMPMLMEEAHAIMCEQGRWVCNEKRLIEAAGLNALQSAFETVPAEPARLLRWVDQVAAWLQVAENETMPWSDSHRDDQDLG